ncbi:TonB-dependent receptor [Pseudoalteromonas sp. BZB3]|uniref:TonB-dependent receptor n=1 Tax=Pseudoalteromonas sp. BZB3 TaxID=3136670 RepID=UPI0032C42F8B
MRFYVFSLFRPSMIALAVSTAVLPSTFAHAQTQPNTELKAQLSKEIETIQVTATRRKGTVQEAPLNITAVDNDVMKQQNITDLESVSRWVPGLTITDQGGRESSPIIVRGLNTNSSERASDSGTVATYLGEIPLSVNLRLTDIERVEVLIGPQGTLYGAGTLGGAIRYMLKAPELDYTEVQVSGDVFALSESDGQGGEFGAVLNLPLIEDTLALRTSFNHYTNPGYIDYNYIVKTPGVSKPDIDWNNSEEVAQNITQHKDANDESITTARVSLRYQPSDVFEATLNYFYQKQKNGANSISQHQSLASSNPLADKVGKYESAYRVLEPNTQEDELLSLELKVDLDFAELVSATGLTDYEQVGQRDQTDLLYDIWPGYADFPSFTALTDDTSEVKNLTQEIRLVSKTDTALNWIAGVYYNKTEGSSDDREYTPGLSDFWGGDITNIEKDLEYLALGEYDNKEQAIFGEVGYAFSDKLNATVGARFYEYEVKSLSGAVTPLYSGDISNINQVPMELVEASDNGSLFKFNLDYKWDNNIMTYFTISEGFRLGGGNGIMSCPDVLPDQQIICALPHEVDYKPDTTTNYELGLKSTWFKNKLHLNIAAFNVLWNDAQIQATTVNGKAIITSNAGEAQSKGIEFATRAILTDNLSTYLTYSYADAKLTQDAPALFAVFSEDDYSSEEIAKYQPYYDGEKGDRLPGAPKHQLSFGVTYNTDVLEDKLLTINYGLTAQSDVITKVGLKADGETLAGYAMSNLSFRLAGEAWSTTLYVNNLFDKYAQTSVRRDKSWAGEGKYPELSKSLPQLQRVYGHYVTTPRTIGLKFDYQFEL